MLKIGDYGSPGGLATIAGRPANRKLCRTMNDDALMNRAITGGADLPGARDEVFDVHQSSTRRLANRLFMTADLPP